MSPGPHATSNEPGYAPEFAYRVLQDALSKDACVYGISGLQGSGKSTLARQVGELGKQHGCNVVVLSIDDFYLDHDDRQALARNVHPLLATRGPPGTHDLPLAFVTLDGLTTGEDTPLPRFDKISDRRLPRSEWPMSGHADLVILEGWFLKTPAQTAEQLAVPVNALERDEDASGEWRRYCNEALARDYPPLWRRLDRMMLMQGPGFDIVPEWRWQQEQTLQAANPHRRAMTQAQVLHFVQFFERVSRQALATLPDIADWTLPLDRHHQPKV